MLRTRIKYAVLALATIVVGLLVHGIAAQMPAAVRDVLGDALWAMMIVWWIGALLPRREPVARGAIAYGICVVVETSQLYHAPWIDAIRDTRLGNLALGSGFDPRDLVAYAAGVAIAVMIDIIQRGSASARSRDATL